MFRSESTLLIGMARSLRGSQHTHKSADGRIILFSYQFASDARISELCIPAPQPWIAFDACNNFSGRADNSDRWDFFGNPADFKSGSSSIPYCGFDSHAVLSCSEQSGVSGIVSELPTCLFQQCVKVAPDAGTPHDSGCFVSGNSVMVPPKVGTFGTMGRNLFRDTGFKNVDFSVSSSKSGTTLRSEPRFFNLFNHPIISNPYGASNGYGGASGGTNDMGNAQHVWLRVRHTRRGGRQSAGWFGKQPRDATRVEVD